MILNYGRKLPEQNFSRKWQPNPAFLPGKSHGWRSLVDYSPWGHRESDTTERLHFHFNNTSVRATLWAVDKLPIIYNELSVCRSASWSSCSTDCWENPCVSTPLQFKLLFQESAVLYKLAVAGHFNILAPRNTLTGKLIVIILFLKCKIKERTSFKLERNGSCFLHCSIKLSLQFSCSEYWWKQIQNSSGCSHIRESNLVFWMMMLMKLKDFLCSSDWALSQFMLGTTPLSGIFS